MNSTHAERVGELVRAEMIGQRLSQDGLARSLGRNQQWLSRRLTGEVSFTVEELTAIASRLRIDVTELLPEAVA